MIFIMYFNWLGLIVLNSFANWNSLVEICRFCLHKFYLLHMPSRSHSLAHLQLLKQSKFLAKKGLTEISWVASLFDNEPNA